MGKFEDECLAADNRLSDNSFRVIKHPGMDSADVIGRIKALAGDIEAASVLRDGSTNRELLSDPVDKLSPLSRFLNQVLGKVCGRADSVTVVVEPEHVDEVYADLVTQVYSHEHFGVSRRAIRLAIFAEELCEKDFFLRPGKIEDWDTYKKRLSPTKSPYPSLLGSFVGVIVVEPRFSATVGRTLLDPCWVSDSSIEVRLTDFDVTIRGKRLMVSSFPWRAQDGEALSCAETTILNMVTYFSNEYHDYPITLPHKLLEHVGRRLKERAAPSQGLDSHAVVSVLASFGFMPRIYQVQSLSSKQVLGEEWSGSARLCKVARAYVDSGLPVAVNLQPSSENVGHMLLLVGLSSVRRGLGWDFNEHYAERIVERPAEGGEGRTAYLMDAADYERGFHYCVIDDSLPPFETRPWSELSAFHYMEAEEIIVPTTPEMAMGALEARDRAGEILRSPRYGLVSALSGLRGSSVRLVLTQRLVSVRSYLRFRVGTCDPDVASIWETGSFPKYAWLFECSEVHEGGKRMANPNAVAELLIDATASPRADPLGGVVLLRYPGFIHYHATDGSGLTTRDGVPYEFVAFDRNLRRVTPHTVKVYADDQKG